MRRLGGKLTYADVMATIAVFLVLSGGAAYAAGHFGKNSVGTKQIRNNAVTAAKIKSGAVTGSKVKDGSLTGADISGAVASANHAISADSASHASSADSASHASKADSATNAEKLDGLTSAGFGGIASSRTVLPGTAVTATTNFWTISGIGAVQNSALQVSSLSPGTATVARNLAVDLSAAPGSNNVVQIRLIVNGSPSALECTVANGGTTDIQSAASVPVSAGSTLSLQALEIVSGAALPAETVQAGFQLTPG